MFLNTKRSEVASERSEYARSQRAADRQVKRRGLAVMFSNPEHTTPAADNSNKPQKRGSCDEPVFKRHRPVGS